MGSGIMGGIERPIVGSQDENDWVNRPDANPTTRRRQPLECPNCGADLKFGILRFADRCPVCREEVDYSISHNLLRPVVALFLDIMVVGALGLTGFILIASLLILLFPAAVLAHILLLTFVLPQVEASQSNHNNAF
jgi:uncharacterized protein (DUF983 family)